MKLGLRIGLLTVVSGGLLFFQNCAKVDFQEDLSSLKKNQMQCGIELVKTTRDMKILFVIDRSGSNNTTDTNSWRSQTVDSFFSKYAGRTNFHYAFITFAGSTAKIYGNGEFSNVSSTYTAAFVDAMAGNDSGNTPYQAALGSIEKMIQDDFAKLPPDSGTSYIVIMISDGQPSDTRYTTVANGMMNLEIDVNKIMTIAPEQIVINSVYIYNQNKPTFSDTKYLEKISQLGHGSFIEADANKSIPINDTIKVPGQNCTE